jgi:hypothetical protein
MKQPTWSAFFLRVGGVSALFVAAILLAKEYYPGKEAYAAGGTAAFVFVVLAIKEFAVIKRTKSVRNHCNKSK